MFSQIAEYTGLAELNRMSKRQLLFQILNFGLIIASALTIWKGLMLFSGSESPIVVVLSGSMEPAFHRGDLLFLENHKDQEARAGSVAVFKLVSREVPIVHRQLKIHYDGNRTKILTKGDANSVDDRGLYTEETYKEGSWGYITRTEVVGEVKGNVPFIGMVTIAMNDYPKLKYVILGLLGLFVLIHRDS